LKALRKKRTENMNRKVYPRAGQKAIEHKFDPWKDARRMNRKRLIRTVIFPKVSSEAKRLEVVIKDVAGMKERTFNWDVQ